MKHLVPCVLTLCALPALSQAQVLLSENFNSLTPQDDVTSAGLFHTLFKTTVDIVGGASCYGPASGVCINLGKSSSLVSNDAFKLVPGTTYTLSFDLLGAASGSAKTATAVSLGPYLEAFNLGPRNDTDGVVSTSFTVKTEMDARLLFTSFITDIFGNSTSGAILDNVSLTARTLKTGKGTGVPEPATLGLLALGLAAAAAGRRRRQLDRSRGGSAVQPG
jgi:hypothetical protein